MTTINLRDFYPWYRHDEFIEVAVAEGVSERAVQYAIKRGWRT